MAPVGEVAPACLRAKPVRVLWGTALGSERSHRGASKKLNEMIEMQFGTWVGEIAPWCEKTRNTYV